MTNMMTTRSSGPGFLTARVAVLITVLIAVLTRATAFAEDERQFRRAHNLAVGLAFTGITPKITASRDGGGSAAVDFERLGVQDDDLNYFLEYRWRFKPKWALILTASKFDGTGFASARETFEFDDITVDAGADVRANVEIDVYLADVLYQVYESENSELMVGGGIHALDLGASLQVQTFLNEEEASLDRAGATLLAPVPNLRFSYLYSTGRWGLTMNGGWLSANIDEYSGDFVYGHVRAHYRFAENWTASLGYQYTDIDVEQKRSLSTIGFDMVIDGPTFTVTYGF